METPCGYLGKGYVIRDIEKLEVKGMSFLRYLLGIISLVCHRHTETSYDHHHHHYIIICHELSLNRTVSACIRIYAKGITL
jgi:hypothetical protein